ncbi:Hypothetical predicted protein [Cloeon dipterum]|uniref:Sulfotransferase domain-containing protein n=1 Tax=Cloeon dipterum TaxID=197152 RepID=A0A8S1E7P4_9INSE|nr:Hypothetical predicted protein [Cloeon dipterum]CAB3387683.1 Hypothetical predicted protein [Cloeon dipterum]
MFRIIVILIVRGINNVWKRGKYAELNRNCLCYGSILLALIYYNCVIRAAINSARRVLSEPVAELEDLRFEPDTSVVEYFLDPDEPTKPRLPDAYIIGVRKCGTLAVADFLGVHPDIVLVDKELHYFDNLFSNGIDWYKSNMPAAADYQVVVERCPSYFTNAAVPEKIFKTNPDAKIILGVRDPIQRSISEYAQMEKEANGKFFKPYREFAFIQGNMGRLNENWTALQDGLYAKHLQPWLRYFPRRQLFIFKAEDLVAEPAKVLKRLQVFLQIRFYVSAAHFKANGTGAFPCIVDPADTERECLNGTLRATSVQHPRIEWGIIHNLKIFFRQHVNDFHNITGIRFGWI